MEKAKTLLLRNTMCDFSCPWVNKLDGSDGHNFVKGEVFEVPEYVERKRNGKKVQVSSMELLEAMFPKGIEIAKGAVSGNKLKEKDDEIAKLKAELAKMKKDKKDSKPDESNTAEGSK